MALVVTFVYLAAIITLTAAAATMSTHRKAARRLAIATVAWLCVAILLVVAWATR